MVRITLSLLTIPQLVFGAAIGCIFVIDYCLAFFRQSSRGTSSDFAKNQLPRFHHHRTSRCRRDHRAASRIGPRRLSQSKVDGKIDVLPFQSAADFVGSGKLCHGQWWCVCEQSDVGVYTTKRSFVHAQQHLRFISDFDQPRKTYIRLLSQLDCVIYNQYERHQRA